MGLAMSLSMAWLVGVATSTLCHIVWRHPSGTAPPLPESWDATVSADVGCRVRGWRRQRQRHVELLGDTVAVLDRNRRRVDHVLVVQGADVTLEPPFSEEPPLCTCCCGPCDRSWTVRVAVNSETALLMCFPTKREASTWSAHLDQASHLAEERQALLRVAGERLRSSSSTAAADPQQALSRAQVELSKTRAASDLWPKSTEIVLQSAVEVLDRAPCPLVLEADVDKAQDLLDQMKAEYDPDPSDAKLEAMAHLMSKAQVIFEKLKADGHLLGKVSAAREPAALEAHRPLGARHGDAAGGWERSKVPLPLATAHRADAGEASLPLVVAPPADASSVPTHPIEEQEELDLARVRLALNVLNWRSDAAPQGYYADSAAFPGRARYGRPSGIRALCE